MTIKRILVMVLFFFAISFLAPKTLRAVDLAEVLTAEDSIVVKVQEGIEYFFAFRVEKKVQVLEKHAEKRLVMAQEYADGGNQERVQDLVQSYLQIKERQTNLLGETDGEEVLGAVEERTIEQQRIMEEIKMKIDEDVKQEVVQVQERVVNQVAQTVIDANGTEGLTEFFEKVEHVWAPGTAGPASEPGVVVEGGTIQFAPGTSAGGPSGADIKTTEVVTGGGEGDGGGTAGEGGGGGLAPGTTSGGGVDQGTSPDSGGTWIAP